MRFYIVLLAVLLSVLSVVERGNAIQRRQNECPSSIPTVTVGQTLEVLPTSDEDLEECAMFKLNIPPTFTQDLFIGFSKTGYGVYYANTVALIREEEYIAENTYQSADFTVQTNFTIPNCAIYDSTYNVVVLSNDFFPETFNLTFLPLPPTPFRTVEAGTTLISGSVNQESFDLIELPLLDPSHSNYVLKANATDSISFYMLDGGCPTLKHGKYFNAYAPDPDYSPYLRTHKPDVPIYIYVESSFDTDYFLDLSFERVDCQVPNPEDMDACDNVDYKTAIYDPQEIAIKEEDYAFTIRLLSGACRDSFQQLICGTLFPMCDDDGFPQTPCSQDCQNAETACEGQFEVEQAFDISKCVSEAENAAQTHCYTSAGSATVLQNGARVSALLLLFFVLLN